MRGRPKAKAVKEYKKAFDRKFQRERQVVTPELPEQALERLREPSTAREPAVGPR